jgi:hypothetical protein
MKKFFTVVLLVVITVTLTNAQKKPKAAKAAHKQAAAAGVEMAKPPFPNVKQLKQMAARFTPTPIKADTSKLSPGDQKALVKLIQAARLMNDVFMQQYWSGDLATYTRLQNEKTPIGRARLHYFWINKGPWSELDGLKAFMPKVPARKPLGANFYPEDMTKDEFESWVKTLPPNEKQQAEGFFTVLRRDAKGGLIIVPFSEAYRTNLSRASILLREAAALTDNETLKKFLNTRAEAFLNNNYFDSDVAWMDLDAPLDITIGPYETYDDELFGYKAAFEAYVNLRDDAETQKLQVFSKHLQELENNLPEEPQYRNPKLGASSPIRVVNEILSAGDGEKGIQTAAYNLPNDDKVIEEKGSKRVMLKNVQEAKFKSVLIPIAKRTLAPNEQGDVSFDMFFTHILAHELMHGLGPHQIKVNGQETNARLALRDVYSPIEEAKADATGLWALQYMMDHASEMQIGNTLRTDETAQRQLYITFLASGFRSLRFGTHEAHGKGMALQFNYLLDKGAFIERPDEIGRAHV